MDRPLDRDEVESIARLLSNESERLADASSDMLKAALRVAESSINTTQLSIMLFQLLCGEKAVGADDRDGSIRSLHQSISEFLAMSGAKSH